jgi:hypothetical protein
MVRPKETSRVGGIVASITGAIREHIIKRFTRSSKWPAVRHHHLVLNPRCAACGGIKALQVHHIIPFDDRPDLELDYTNLITLCMAYYDCHLHIGHGGNYSFFNPNVVTASALIRTNPSMRKQMELEALVHRKDRP